MTRAGRGIKTTPPVLAYHAAAMGFGESIIGELQVDRTLWLALIVLISHGVVGRGEPRRLRTSYFLFSTHVVLALAAGVLLALASDFHKDVRLAAAVAGVLAAVAASGALVFRGIMPRIRVEAPQIVQDVAVAGAGLVAAFAVASRYGLNLSGIIATSAVLTAVIGLALQDTLGNVVGGLALQTDESIRVGDWVKVGDVSGRVAQIRWRYTAIETRNWETVVVPNSVLLKNQVTVFGRRHGQPVQWRRWVWFNVDFRTPPPDVIQIVEAAMRSSSMPNVASTPAPHVILMDFTESWGRYAARYFLTDIAVDDPTDHLVRQRIYFALQRAGIGLSIPAHAVFMTEDTPERRAEKAQAEADRRRAAIAAIDLFGALPDEERERLAGALRYAPFAKGEALTKQGAKAHWLYVVTEGECAVRVEVDGGEREVGKVGAGEFFGEMSLLTGADRAATVVASTEVECWRLDRAAFQSLLQRHPGVAEDAAETLARRQMELLQVREHLSKEAAAKRMAQHKQDLLGKIRDFFGLDDRPSMPS